MELNGKVAIVTGGGGGIGSALARAALDAGAKVLVADLDGDAAAAAIAGVDGDRALAVGADVSDEAALQGMIDRAEAELGPVDAFFANAGVATGAELGAADEWELALDVNLIAHVRAARLLVPRWLERGGGYFVTTGSAAGLLTQIGSAPYAVTKHAAVGFAEWLSVTYGERGVRVSCLCPMGVRTAMVEDGLASDDPAARLAARTVTTAGAVLEPEEVARVTLAAIADERFLILPHPEVLEFYRRKGADYDRWLDGMRRLQRQVDQAP
ncbi:MAG: SDR family oxidoreductase [Actinobacteria bacterium]|nr:SDR family oxidoreductase [Actinomycetota bacterium]